MADLEHIRPIIKRTQKRFRLTPPVAKEWHEQRILFEWAKLNEGREPRLKLLNGSMNGLEANPRSIVMAKLCGLKPGFPDTNLPVGNLGVSFGKYVEIKRKHQDWEKCGWKCATTDQIWWRDVLRAEGYEVDIAHGAEQAIALYKAYLEIK